MQHTFARKCLCKAAPIRLLQEVQCASQGHVLVHLVKWYCPSLAHDHEEVFARMHTQTLHQDLEASQNLQRVAKLI